ncbi:hypothetical protein QFZ51_002726 [Chitinophaga sp. W3I9]|uniref:hypothetical protein n=1 Tax=Chitinophaga sp. W3I9 TaxID=3373924 RepID=UPI003D1F2935
MNHKENIPRRISTIVAYMHPFRIVESQESGKWETDIDQINNRAWNYVQLHEIVGGLDVGLNTPYHLVIGFDGALALPPIPELRDPQRVVEFYNKCLAALLLGGVYCEAINLDSIETGVILDWKYIRIIKPGKSASSIFHHLARLKMLPPLTGISLLNPHVISYYSLYKAMDEGMEIINKIPNLSSEFLLKGTTGIARLDWGVALSNLWIIIEQLISYLWQEKILKNIPTGSDKIDGQKEQLSDTRTWGMANRIELLYQTGILTASIVKWLSNARKIRNKLVHDGKHPPRNTAIEAYNPVLELITIIIGKNFSLQLLNFDDHLISDPFKAPNEGNNTPDYWMPFPKLPGEDDISKEKNSKHS